MKILFVQISDIHIMSESDGIFRKKTKLIEAIQNEAKAVDEVFISVTGDIAFSGSVNEFELGKDFFDDVITMLKEYSGKNINIIFLPGNHDCQNLKKENKAREGLITLFQNNGADSID